MKLSELHYLIIWVINIDHYELCRDLVYTVPLIRHWVFQYGFWPPQRTIKWSSFCYSHCSLYFMFSNVYQGQLIFITIYFFITSMKSEIHYTNGNMKHWKIDIHWYIHFFHFILGFTIIICILFFCMNINNVFFYCAEEGVVEDVVCNVADLPEEGWDFDVFNLNSSE